MYSVIVPTMWKTKDLFLGFLNDLVKEEMVGEVIIIDNAPELNVDDPVLDDPKVFIFEFGQNVFVYPALNFGIRQSNFDNICLLNDDLVFDTKAFAKIASYLSIEGTGYVGIAPGVRDQPPMRDESIDIVEWIGQDTWGYGCLMFFNKQHCPVFPDELLVFYGDNYVFDYALSKGKKNYFVSNMRFFTPYHATSSDREIVGDIYLRDQAAFFQLRESLQIDGPRFRVG